MPHASDPDLLVLHALRLRGFAEADVVADATGLGVRAVTERLDAFEGRGLVRHREGRVSGWTLTAAGRVDGERRLSAELDELDDARRAVADAYGQFLAANAPMLEVCTDWQMRLVDGRSVVNDHTDPAYDATVIERLASLDAEVQPVCATLARLLDRFAGYRHRFATALARVQGGDTDWFTKPTIDSYHTVWFELHENLLATLGIERGSETQPGAA